jgi:hypothetical protein
MKAFPVMTGMCCSRLTIRRQVNGFGAASVGASVLSVAHLYRAVRGCGVMKKAWEDMDFFIDIMGKSKTGLYDLNSGKPALSAAKQSGMALGVTLQDFQKVARKNKGRSPRATLPSEDTISERAEELRCLPLLFEILNDCGVVNQNLGFSNDGYVRQGLARFVQKILEDKGVNIDANIRETSRETRQITFAQMLALVMAHYVEEEPKMNFDHHMLTLNCMSVIDVLVSEFRTRIKNAREAWNQALGHKERRLMPWDLVNEVLWEAADAELSGSRWSRPGTMLHFLGGFLNECLDELPEEASHKSNSNLEDAMSLSSGHLDEELKPRPAGPDLDYVFTVGEFWRSVE